MRDRIYYWWWFKQQMEEYMRQFLLSSCPLPRNEDMPLYNKCKNPACGRMKLAGFRCNICYYTDPDEPMQEHDALCMCILCIPTPKDADPNAADTNQAIAAQDHYELGGEAGSFLSRLKPVEQVVDETLSVLIYGRNRIGKTRLATEFPKPMVYLSLEPTKTGGAKSLPKTPGIEVMVVNDSATLMGVASDLINEKHGFKSVVLDSATSMEKFILQEVMGWDEPAEQLRVGKSSPVQTEHYTDRSERMKKLIRPFLGLPMNVIILANEKDHNPPSGEGGQRKNSFNRGMQQDSYFAADTGAGMARWLMDSCDYILQMLMDSEKKSEMIELVAGQPKVEVVVETQPIKLIRRLRLGYHPQFAAGGRSDKALPDFIDGAVDPKTGMNSKNLYENFIKAIK